MNRTILALTCLVSAAHLHAVCQEPKLPTFDYDVTHTHEIKPHRRTVPLAGVHSGFNQLHLTLKVSPSGDVVAADPGNAGELLKFWPGVKDEVFQWKFKPFEQDGMPVAAEVEEYVDLVPPELIPTVHAPKPILHHDSKIAILLQRGQCYGRCPAYRVTVSTEGVVFDGYAFVASKGKHTEKVDADAVRLLAKQFIDADFFSMNNEYIAGVTDNSTYILSLTIDGHTKKVVDYVGSWVGMPAVITDLEDDVDALADTDQWIKGKGEKP